LPIALPFLRAEHAEHFSAGGFIPPALLSAGGTSAPPAPFLALRISISGRDLRPVCAQFPPAYPPVFNGLSTAYLRLYNGHQIYQHGAGVGDVSSARPINFRQGRGWLRRGAGPCWNTRGTSVRRARGARRASARRTQDEGLKSLARRIVLPDNLWPYLSSFFRPLDAFPPSPGRSP